MKKALVGVLFLAALAGGAFLFLKQAPAEVPVLNLYIWTDYADKEVLAAFEKEYGVRVNEENYPSNEAMMAKLKAGGSGYDIVVPSDYVVATMIQENLLAPLDKSRVPNVVNLAPEFRQVAYDPTGTYVVPYMFGTTGIAYNASKITNPPKSWAEFFDATRLAGLEKRVSLLDDPREVLGAALKRNGKSLNTTDAASLEEAKQVLLAAKPHIGRIDTMSYKDLLASGDVWLAHSYSGEVSKLRLTNPEITFVIPQEGGTIWADNLAIPANAPNKELAAKFIDFVMRPDMNAKLASTNQYATANGEARKLLAPEVLANPNIYPTAELRERLEWFADLGEATEAVDTAWNEVRAGTGSAETTAVP
ncbi:MAG: spermidine/putrescine ABC transporter substrate-binding protein [Silvanigrellales bacterium]|nr:spermidine/putrescine ABC transporter substrate-binding protein [Silvanigrellales bacterium]